MKILQIIVPAILSLQMVMASCSTRGVESNAEKDEEHEHAEGAIIIEPEQAAEFGIATDTVCPSTFSEIIPAAGRIMASAQSAITATAPVAGIVTFRSGINAGTVLHRGQTIATIAASAVAGGNQNAAAKANLEAARRELARITPLFEEGIATRRELSEARRAVEEAEALYSPAASTVVKGSAASTITELLVADKSYVEAGTPVASLIASGNIPASTIIEAYLPQNHTASLPYISACSFRTPDGRWLHSSPGAKSSPAAAGQSGYITLYFNTDSASAIYPGTTVEVRLIGRERQGVISVDRNALTEQMGQLFVYCKTGAHEYVKKPVTVGADNGERAEIISGLESGDVVVTRGATFVKLAETSTAVPEGHSHSH